MTPVGHLWFRAGTVAPCGATWRPTTAAGVGDWISTVAVTCAACLRVRQLPLPGVA